MSDRNNQYIRAFFGVRSSSIGLALITGVLFGGGFYVANGQEAEPQTVLRSYTSPTPMRRSENFQSNVTRTYVRSDGVTRTETAPTSRTLTRTSSAPVASTSTVTSSTTAFSEPVVTRTYTRRVNGVVEYQGQEAPEARTTVRSTITSAATPVAPVVATEPAPVTSESRTYVHTETRTTSPAPVIETASIAPPLAASRHETVNSASAVQASGGYQPGYRAPAVVPTVESQRTASDVRPASAAPEAIRMSAQVTPVSAITSEDLPSFETPAGTVPDGATLHQIIWSTLMVISDAQNQGDFSYFQQIISPRLRSEVVADDLPSYFEGLRSNREQLTGAIGEPADFELIPYLLPDGRLRLRGAFDVAPRDLRFDLLYANVQGVWMVDAIAFADGA